MMPLWPTNSLNAIINKFQIEQTSMSLEFEILKLSRLNDRSDILYTKLGGQSPKHLMWQDIISSAQATGALQPELQLRSPFSLC